MVQESSINKAKLALMRNKRVKNFKGRILFFCPDERRYCHLTMDELILRAHLIGQRREEEEKRNSNKAVDEADMRAPENPNKKQKVFVIERIDQKCLNMIFWAFKINKEMRTEMSLT